MFGLGMQELVIVLLVVLLLFGAKRLPEVGRSLGRAISSFKEGLRQGEDDILVKGTDGDKKG